MHPTGSCPGIFGGTAKIYKLFAKSSINDVPIQPILSNLNTATNNLAKCLSKFLSPLWQSRNTVKNMKEFIEDLKQQKWTQEHKYHLIFNQCSQKIH